MWPQFWVLFFFITANTQDPFDRAIFECNRMPLSLCCTSRLRENCLSRCSAIQCVGDSFYKQVIDRQFSRLQAQLRTTAIPSESAPTIPRSFAFSTDHTIDEINSGIDFRSIGLATFRNGKHDGEAFGSGSGAVISKGPPLAETPFPTLIPSVDIFGTTLVPENKGALVISATSSPFTVVLLKNRQVEGATSVQSRKSGDEHERIQPRDGSDEESLVRLSGSDYDTDPPSVPVFPIPPPIPPNSFIASSTKINPNGLTAPAVPLNSIWSIRITPHVGSTSGFDGHWKNIAAWRKTDAEPGSPMKVSLEKGLSSVISALLGGKKRRNRTDKSTRSPAPSRETTILTSQLPPQFVSTTQQTILPTISIAETIPAPHCGVPPHFSPCVSTAVANSRMLQCCRAKSLPVGCQNLCRYDVTQHEIKAALDAAQCGILHVAPIVQCASEGHDNIDCCRYKEVALKSGPQCEVFCRAGDNIKNLGLQHLICNTVLNDLIKCHHAGLRP